jgi:hypothetical protein
VFDVLAGLLVVKFDSSPYGNTLFIILAALVAIDMFLLGVVYKRAEFEKRFP